MTEFIVSEGIKQPHMFLKTTVFNVLYQWSFRVYMPICIWCMEGGHLKGIYHLILNLINYNFFP